MIRFFISFVIAVILIALPPLALHYYKSQLLLPQFDIMFAFFTIVTLVVCVNVVIGQHKTPKLGTQLFLAATVIKLLACMSFAVIYLLNYAVNGVIFIGSFFYLYFCFTVFEIYSLLSNLRVQNEKEKSR